MYVNITNSKVKDPLKLCLTTNFSFSFAKVYKPNQHLTRSNSQPARPQPGLKRYSSVEEATDYEKELIRTSLTDLCFRQGLYRKGVFF